MTETERTDRTEEQMNQAEKRTDRTAKGTEAVAGHRAVLLIVGLSVGIVGSLGFLIGVFGPSTLDVGQIGPITFPVTPVTLATYGLVTTGAALGVFVVLVAGVVYYVNSNDDAV